MKLPSPPWVIREPRYSSMVSCSSSFRTPKPVPRPPLSLPLVCFSLVLLGACAHAPAAPPRLAQLETPEAPAQPANPLIGAPAEITVPAKPLSLSQRTAAEIHVMAGEMAAQRRQPEQAALHFLEALGLVDDAELAQRATALSLASGNRELTLRAAQKWLELEPNEMDPREVIARVSVENGAVAEAQKQCAAIVSGHAGGVDEGLAYAARLLAQASTKSAETALTVMQNLAQQYPQSSPAQQALGIVALRFGRLEAAEQAARKAKQLAPQAKEPAVLLAGVLVRVGKLDEADALFENLISSAEEPAELRLGYAKVLLEASQREAARTQTRKALAAKPGYADALYALGVMAFNDRAYDEAESNFKQALSGERAMEATYQLGLIAEARGNDALALSYFEKVGSGSLALDAAIRRGHVLTRLQRIPEARELMARLREQLPHVATRLYIAEATMLGDAGAYDLALAVFVQALKEQPDDSELLYSRSLLHEKQSRVDLAEADLRAMLRADADDARAMNALGYMLTVHTQRYTEARKLIERALELEPEDAAILDSLGWVQFKLGKAGEARELLQKAHTKMPDPEVAAHLGEVLWTLGEKDNAKSVWDRALKSDPDHRVLNETVKRFLQ